MTEGAPRIHTETQQRSCGILAGSVTLGSMSPLCISVFSSAEMGHDGSYLTGVERMKQVTSPKAQEESWHTAVLEQCLLFHADTVRDRATVTYPSPASAPRPLPLQKALPLPGLIPGPSLIFPHLLPYHPFLFPAQSPGIKIQAGSSCPVTI